MLQGHVPNTVYVIELKRNSVSSMASQSTQDTQSSKQTYTGVT